MIKRLNVLISYLEKKAGRSVIRSRPWKISLEVALSCNLRCITCSHGTARFGGIMSEETFDRAKPILALAKVVNEVGYGEPLLDRHFVDKLQYIKGLGATVYAYSNAMPLTSELSERLVALQLDQLTFSIDGATKDTFESIRVGADFGQVLENIRQLHEVKVRRRSRRPFLRANYVGMRRNIEELPLAVRTLAEIGIQEVVLSDMMPPNAELASEHLSHFPDITWTAIAEARRVAGECRVAFTAPSEFRCFTADARGTSDALPREGERGGATAPAVPRVDGPHRGEAPDFYRSHPCYEPWQTAYITHDGNVRPCCTMNRSFGNLFEQDLAAIWNNGEYRSLRRTVNSRSPVFPECRECLLRRRVRFPLVQLAAMGAKSAWHLGLAQTARKAVKYLTEYS